MNRELTASGYCQGWKSCVCTWFNRGIESFANYKKKCIILLQYTDSRFTWQPQCITFHSQCNQYSARYYCLTSLFLISLYFHIHLVTSVMNCHPICLRIPRVEGEEESITPMGIVRKHVRNMKIKNMCKQEKSASFMTGPLYIAEEVPQDPVRDTCTCSSYVGKVSC